MIKERARVITVNHNEVTVVSEIKSSCKGCSQVDNCGSGQIAKALPHAKLKLTLKYDVENTGKVLIPGDSIMLALPEKDVLASAGQVYLLPLFGLISFSAIGQWLFKQQLLSHELYGLAIGFLGAYIGFRFAKFIQKNLQGSNALQPQILSLAPPTTSSK
jgi:sigma-E factor negative regulatory protein RseC